MTPLKPCAVRDSFHNRLPVRLVALVLLAGAAVPLRAGTFGGIDSGIALTGVVIVILLAVTALTLGWLLRQWRGAAAALDRSLSTLNVTFDSISDGVLVVGGDGRVTNYNQRFLDLWRIPADLAEKRDDDHMLRHVLDQLSSPDVFLDRVRGVYSHPDESTSGDVLLFKDGRVFERDSRPQRKGSEVIGRVWSFRDVTARHRASEEKESLSSQLAQAQKLEAIGTLAGGIAHDFNNILVGIIGYAELAAPACPPRIPSATISPVSSVPRTVRANSSGKFSPSPASARRKNKSSNSPPSFATRSSSSARRCLRPSRFARSWSPPSAASSPIPRSFTRPC